MLTCPFQLFPCILSPPFAEWTLFFSAVSPRYAYRFTSYDTAGLGHLSPLSNACLLSPPATHALSPYQQCSIVQDGLGDRSRILSQKREIRFEELRAVPVPSCEDNEVSPQVERCLDLQEPTIIQLPLHRHSRQTSYSKSRFH